MSRNRFMKSNAPPVVGTMVVALVAITPACSPGAGDEGTGATWAGTITTEGDITRVVNDAGSVWGSNAALVEALSIGVEMGEEPL